MKKIFTLLFITLLFASCSKKNDLELIIEEKEIVITDTSVPKSSAKEYTAKNGTIINYKLVNNSNETYIILIDTEEFGRYPKYSRSFLTPNLNFLFDNDSIVEEKLVRMSGRIQSDNFMRDSIVFYYGDSLIKEPYKKIGYTVDNPSFYRFLKVNEKTVVIHPGQVLHFRTFTTLPYMVKNDGFQCGYHLDPKQQYYVRLNLSNSKEGIFEYLTDEKKKDFKTNDYKFFEGIIYSNKVPVRFKNKSIN